MQRFLQLFLFLFALALPLLALHNLADATPIAPPEKPIISPAPSLPPLPASPIAAQLNNQIQNLIAGPTTQAEKPAEDETVVEPAPTFGTQALGIVLTFFELVRERTTQYTARLGDIGQVFTWLDQQTTDPRLINRWTIIGGDCVNILGTALLISIFAEILTYPLRRIWRQRTPHTFGGRFSVLASLFGLRAIPIFIFIGVTAWLLQHEDIQKLSRFIILNIAYAFALVRIAIAVARGLLAPRSAHLRLVPLESAQAARAMLILNFYSVVIISGYFILDVARAVRVPDGAIVAFTYLLGVFLVSSSSLLIIFKHRAVTDFFKQGHYLSSPANTLFDSAIKLVLKMWPVLAVIYLVGGYAIAVSGIENGLAILLRGTLVTIAVIVALRLIFARAQHHHNTHADTKKQVTSLHKNIFRFFLRLLLVGSALLIALAGWGMDLGALFASPLGQRLLGAGFSVGLTVLILTILYQLVSTAIDHHVREVGQAGGDLFTSSRTLTILPLLRNTLYVVSIGIVALVAMSEAGFNIGPLLAGAGILGVAVGFGSQTLVKDFLTGLFIVIENAVAVGDTVKIGEHVGKVEAMSIRTIRLRDYDGTLHLLPFSEVSKISNMTKDFAFAPIRVGVGYQTDLDKAMEIMNKTADQLRLDDKIGPFILEPLEIQGVDSLGAYSVDLMARLRTRPGKQWDVRRAYLLKLKQAFDREGIEIPFPTQVQIHKDKKVRFKIVLALITCFKISTLTPFKWSLS